MKLTFLQAVGKVRVPEYPWKGNFLPEDSWPKKDELRVELYENGKILRYLDSSVYNGNIRSTMENIMHEFYITSEDAKAFVDIKFREGVIKPGSESYSEVDNRRAREAYVYGNFLKETTKVSKGYGTKLMEEIFNLPIIEEMKDPESCDDWCHTSNKGYEAFDRIQGIVSIIMECCLWNWKYYVKDPAVRMNVVRLFSHNLKRYDFLTSFQEFKRSGKISYFKGTLNDEELKEFETFDILDLYKEKDDEHQT